MEEAGNGGERKGGGVWGFFIWPGGNMVITSSVDRDHLCKENGQGGKHAWGKCLHVC